MFYSFPRLTQLWTSRRAGRLGILLSSAGDGFSTYSLVLFTLSPPLPPLTPTCHRVLRGKQNYERLRPACLGPDTSQANTKSTK